MADFDEYRALQAADTKRRTEAVAQHRTLQRMVVVQMETLLGADEWTTYRAHLDALAKEADAEKARLGEQIITGRLAGDDLTRTLMQVRYHHGRSEAFREALETPALVIQQAASA